MKNLNKINWGKIKLDDACSFVRGVVFSTKDEVDSGGKPILRSHNVDFENNKVSLHNLKFVSNSVKVKAAQKLMKDDILISVANSKEQTGKVGFSYSDTDAYAGGFMAILKPKSEAIIPFYLFVNLLSPKSKNFIEGGTQGTTNIFNITFERIKDLEIPLPPLEEQQRIADLFQSIEQSIAQAEAQEGNLKTLQKSLSNGLIGNPPVLGNLLSEDNCTPCKFEDVADCIEQHDKKPLENGITRFIGLENIESDNFNLQGFGNIENGTTFTKRFAKGDVLFGKRRAYLKKVAVADFDGICSGDILVLRAKGKNMLADLLPYYVSSEAFINHAVSTSAGSLSPRTKWRDLSGFELSIPDIKTQEKIVAVFNQLRESHSLINQQISVLKTLKQKLLNEILG